VIVTFMIEEKSLVVQVNGNDVTPHIVSAAGAAVHAAGRLALWAGRKYRDGKATPPTVRPAAPCPAPPKGGA